MLAELLCIEGVTSDYAMPCAVEDKYDKECVIADLQGVL